MTILSKAKRLFHKTLGRLPPIDNPRLNDDDSILNRNTRSYSKLIRGRDSDSVRKVFSTTADGRRAFKRERRAWELFGRYEWFPEWRRSGLLNYDREYFPEDRQLRNLIPTMTMSERERCAGKVMSIILDLYSQRAAHCDMHSGNLYDIEGQLKLVDYETTQFYTDENIPAFPQSYDVTGQGMPSPFFTNNMGYASAINSASLSTDLDVSFETGYRHLGDLLKAALLEASLTFAKRSGRHTCHAGKIYNTFSIPELVIGPSIAQRNCSRRFDRFAINEGALKGKRIVDLGSNIGGMIMEATKYSPKECVGVEYDENKVAVARRVAAFASATNVTFLQNDIDKLNVGKLGGLADVTFCLAIEAHVKKNRRLYSLLGKLTRDVLYFEGNAGMDTGRTVRLLKAAGFQSVELLGMCDDDANKSNNNRQLIRATR